MKKFIASLVVASTLLVGCENSVAELPTLLKNTITYSQARDKVQSSQKTDAQLQEGPLARVVDPVTTYFLTKYQAVEVNYEIKSATETINATFEVRGEVFLSALENNQISVTASMPVIKYLYISVLQLEALEELNTEWKASDEFLIAPFTTKYRYASTLNHFGFEIKDFSSTGGGLVTTVTSNEFSYHKDDNKLIGWQFQFWNKDEGTSGTNTIYKTVKVDFNWVLRDA
jgi:hypothetical protein